MTNKRRVLFVIDGLLRQSRCVTVSCEMSSEALGKRREPTPDMLDPDLFAEIQEVVATGAYNACSYSDALDASGTPDSPADTIEKCSEPKGISRSSTSRGRVKLVATLPASFASGAKPETCSFHGSARRRRRRTTRGDWTKCVEKS